MRFDKDLFPSFKPLKGTLVSARTEPKIGRNEPCPCESGKKFKKCCLAKDQPE